MEPLRSRHSETGKCLITWHPDGTLTKQLTGAAALDPDAILRLAYERQINQMLVRDTPPVPFAPLVGSEEDGTVLRFWAVEGEPYGLKFPMALSDDSVAALLSLAVHLPAYRPADSWIRRYDPHHELSLRQAEGVLAAEEFDLVERLIRARDWPVAFAHGDLTPRNVLSSPLGPVLIDWEFAGWYPLAYDRAFLWLVLVELPQARALVTASLAADTRASFWLCAYLIQLMHLGMWAKRQAASPFLARHLATRDYALAELRRAVN